MYFSTIAVDTNSTMLYMVSPGEGERESGNTSKGSKNTGLKGPGNIDILAPDKSKIHRSDKQIKQAEYNKKSREKMK